MKRSRFLVVALAVLVLLLAAGTASAAPLDQYTADLCAPSGASASSTYAGTSPNYAFDDDASTLWGATTTSGWIQPADFASDAGVKRLTIRVRAENYPYQAPRDFSLQYYDGSAWQTAQSWAGETSWLPGEQRIYDVTGDYSSARWRVNITASNGQNIGIAEVEMMAAEVVTPTATPVATSESITVYVDYPTPVPQYFDPTANDGDGPEPWLLRFYVGVFVVFAFTYVLFRLVDTHQFYLLFMALCMAAAWVTRSVNGAGIVYLFMLILLLVLKLWGGLQGIFRFGK